MPFQVDVLKRCPADCIEDTWETVATKDDLSEAKQEIAGLLTDNDDVQITLWEVNDQGEAIRQIDTV